MIENNSSVNGWLLREWQYSESLKEKFVVPRMTFKPVDILGLEKHILTCAVIADIRIK